MFCIEDNMTENQSLPEISQTDQNNIDVDDCAESVETEQANLRYGHNVKMFE